MTAPATVAVLLALAAALAMARIGWRWGARGTETVPAASTATPTPAAPAATVAAVVLLALQPLLAWLLWQALFPPLRAPANADLVVATEATRAADVLALHDGARIVALPEAPALPGVERLPDLATALRRHHAAALRVLGRGLTARDRDAAQGRPLRFDPAPLPRGLVALWREDVARVGRPFRVAGQVAGLPHGRVQLRDPADTVVDTASLASDGGFALHAASPVAGALAYTLVLEAADGRRVARHPLPMQVREGIRPRVLVLAGGPDPELKYLRRWAADAGLDLRARIALGAGVQAGDEGVALDAAALRAADLVLVDERAWRGLDAARRATLRAAVRDGLGLVLRVTGPLDGDTRAAWAALGLPLAAARVPDSVQLPADWLDAGQAHPLDESAWPTRQPLAVADAMARPLLADAQGRALGAWRPLGAGRVGVLWLGDTYRLLLAGEARAHARLWTDVFGALVRGRAPMPPRLEDGPPRVGERSLLCAARGPWRITGPDGLPLPVAPAPHGDEACAAWWPEAAGWHEVQAGDGRLSLDVLAADALPGLRARADREATRALVRARASRVGPQATAAPGDPGPRWPWALGWLLLAALGWWLEWRVLAARPAPVAAR